MANYQETNVSGTKYRRAYQVAINNGINSKSIQFYEEDIVNLDGETIHRRLDGIGSQFTDENSGTSVALLNPVDGTDTGATITYAEIYTALYSLYLHLATERDAAAVEPEPEAP